MNLFLDIPGPQAQVVKFTNRQLRCDSHHVKENRWNNTALFDRQWPLSLNESRSTSGVCGVDLDALVTRSMGSMISS